MQSSLLSLRIRKLPSWSFALSLQKNARLSESALTYIRLFTEYIDSLGLLSGDLTPESLIAELQADN